VSYFQLFFHQEFFLHIKTFYIKVYRLLLFKPDGGDWRLILWRCTDNQLKTF